jgi:putative tryptophan/tyrosine transport system substrate-binding protein
MLTRRKLLAVLATAFAGSPFAGRAQPKSKVPRIGVVLFARDESVINPFVQGLQDRGYVDGKNVIIEYRYAEGRPERLPDAATELVRLNPDVIFSFGGEAAPIVKNATATIPIVVVVSNDPVQSGLVTSLARPGGNVTGLTYVYDLLAGKTLELLKEAAPMVSRVAILWNPNHADPEFRATERAALALRVQLQSLEVRGDGDFDSAFQAAARGRAEALIVVWSRLVALNRQGIADFAGKNGLILVSSLRYWIELGGLLTYGPNFAELIRRSAIYIDKILKGAKPTDLPMQQPTTFELVINLKRAKELGLTIAPSLLARADEVVR